MRTGRARVAQGGVIILVVAGAIASLAFTSLAGTAFFVAYAGAGAYLVVRRPGNAIGGLLTITGCGLAMGSVRVPVDQQVLLAGALPPTQAALVWAYGWGWSLAMLGFLGITLVFPGGHLPDRGGRWASRLAIGAMIVLAGLMAVGPTLLVLPAGSANEVAAPNPLALAGAPFEAGIPPPDTLFTLMGWLVLAGFVAMFARFRRSTGLERLQFRWILAAVGIVLAGSIAWLGMTQGLHLVDDHGAIALAFVVLTYSAIPIAIGIAVLRYRLYEIDRIVSRTIGYGLVTGVLVIVFGGGVIALEAVLAGVTATGGETLAVAGSTLVAFALFQPLRRRVQRSVDRRFDRSRYDGERTSAAFSERLRDEVDLTTVTADLDATVRGVMAPAVMGVWLRGETR